MLLTLLATRAGALMSAGLRLRREDLGQDVIEYALLAAFIGVAGWWVLQSMQGTIFSTYSSWIDPTIGTPSLWEPSAPIGSGS